ncbi:MAG: hypothetical protein IPO00_17720 [Betaproteobacteria bacterium]|nr:hypothetical protein [Betaproteobacteria bacterium]
MNKPFIDAAVARGDDIVLATRPTEITLIGTDNYPVFGREVRYLESLGYKYDPVSSMMLKPK